MQALEKRIVEIHPDVLCAGDDGSFNKFHERYFCTMDKIEQSDEVRIEWYPEDKKDREILSYFGMAFMLNKPVRLLNREKIQPTPHKSYTNVILSVDEICGKGESLPAVNRKVEKNSTYIICTVRNTTPEEQAIFKEYTAELEALGMKVYWPDPNADYQKDSNGLNICLRHRQETAFSRDIRTFWNPKSEGSVFDLANCLVIDKPIKLVKLINAPQISEKEKLFVDLVQLCDAAYGLCATEDILN